MAANIVSHENDYPPRIYRSRPPIKAISAWCPSCRRLYLLDRADLGEKRRWRWCPACELAAAEEAARDEPGPIA